MKKRMLAMVLALALILSLVPTTALAAGDSPEDGTGGEDGTPPTLTYGAWEVDEDTGVWTWIWPDDEDPYKGNSNVSNSPYTDNYGKSGFCTFDPDTGTLTIQSSTHTQYDPGYAERPWADFQDKITSIVAEGSADSPIAIGTRAFSGLTALKSVKLTNCTLGSYAFEQAKINEVEFNSCTLSSNAVFDSAEVTNLTLDSCTLKASNNSSMFGSGTIGNLELTGCTISGTNTNITYMFNGTSVTNIVTNDTDLPAGTFYYAQNVETVTVNGGSLGATYVYGSYTTAFPATVTMQSVTVDGATLSQGALSCPATTITIKNTDLPAYTIYNDYAVQALMLENIGSIASYSICTVPNLKTVTLDTAETLNECWIYYDCTSLESVSLKGVGTLPKYCFWSLSALKEVYLEDIGTVSDKAFYYDSYATKCSLQTVSYKDVDSFSPSAFYPSLIKQYATIEEVQEIPGLDNPLTEPVVWKNGKWEKGEDGIWTYYIDDLTWTWSGSKWEYESGDTQTAACTYNPDTQTLTLLTSTPDYSAEGGQPWTSGGPFDNNSANVIKSITADDSDIAIGAYAFAAIKDLESVTLKGVTLKEYSVANTSAKKITIENVDKLPSYSIASNHELEALTVKNVGEIVLGAIWYNGDQTDDSLSLTLTISDVDTLPSGAIYKNHNLKTLKLENITTLEKYFVSDGYEDYTEGNDYYGSKSLETVELKNVKNISAYAFYNCPELTSLSGLKDAKYIGGYAFYNCPKLKWDYVNDQPSDTAQIGWNQFFQQSEAMIARMKAIMADKFSLAKAQTPDAQRLRAPSGWDDSQSGRNNSTRINGNQVTKSARWTDSDRTEAQVQFQFTSAEEPGADFLFVVDSSASMSIVGNQSDTSGNTGGDGPQLPSDDDVRDTGEDLEPSEDELNARFYAMQSKLLDVTDELLTAQGYDNRVAVLNFGGYYNLKEGTVESTDGFISDADTMKNYLLNDFEPYYENTDFVMALDAAYDKFVANHDTSRKLVVIFISDGIPTMEDTGTTQHQIGVNGGEQSWESTYRPHIAEAAKKITDAGAEIFGVLHLYDGEPDDQVARANSAMSAVCGLYFEADDTEAFSDAVNDAIGAGWGVYTLTDTVDPGFTLVEDSIEVTCGETQVTVDEDGNTVITWTIYGVPFTTYTMTYNVTLNQVDGAYPYGRFDTNKGDAVVTKGIGTEQEVNRVETPRLSRYKDIPVHPVQPGKPDPKPEPEPEPEPPALNTEDHVAYIIGYPDDTVRPNGNITRAEAATIFFRLLTDETRARYWSQTNSYSDVDSGDWFNNAVSTLSSMGIVDGYPDGTFRPNASITRAELTKIAVSFFEYADKNYAYHGEYSDVMGSEWYASFVAAANALGLIEGYPDGTFLPNNPITRAETCTIVNRTLGRKPHEDHLLSEQVMITWPDNPEGAWYYAQMQEATNSHDYAWTTEDDETVEDWTAKLEERDWAALEKAWSNAYSAPGGEVMD